MDFILIKIAKYVLPFSKELFDLIHNPFFSIFFQAISAWPKKLGIWSRYSWPQPPAAKLFRLAPMALDEFFLYYFINRL